MTQFDDAMTQMGRLMREAEDLDPSLLTPEEMARWLATIRGAVKRLRDLEADTVEVLAAVLPHGQPAILDGMVVEASERSSRSGWDNDRVRREVVRAATYDPATGAFRDTEEALSVISRLYPLGGAGLRLTAAKDLIPGWDADEFCASERKPHIKITEAKKLGE